jgi:Pyridoxamine 5'-phosphate oxidase
MSAELDSLQERAFARATRATAESYPPEHRLTGAELARYLDRRAFAVIGSARPDGRPHAAMSAYVREGTTFWLPTMAGSVRERNVRTSPWLTLVVTQGDRNEHIVVIVRGPTSDWAALWLRLEAASLFSYAARPELA